jgi:hypothetical protein
MRCLDPNTCGGNLRVIWVAKPSGNKGVRASLVGTLSMRGEHEALPLQENHKKLLTIN